MLDAIKFISPIILLIIGLCILYLKKFNDFRQKHQHASIDLGVCLIMLGIILEAVFVIKYIIV